MMMESYNWRLGGARASRSKGISNNVVCRKHPKHMQSPGVCSICLNEKLSQLMMSSSVDTSSSSSRAAARSRSSSTSLSSYVSSLSSSNASSSCSSPARVFNKSRSIGIVKRGFWSKFLLPTKTRGRFLMHSRTTRERVVAAFH